MIVEGNETALADDLVQEPDVGEDQEKRLPGGVSNIMQVRVKRMPKDFTGDPLSQRDFPFNVGEYRYRVQVARSRGRRQVVLEGRIKYDYDGQNPLLEKLPNGFQGDPLCERGNSIYLGDFVYRTSSFKNRGRRQLQLLGKAIPLVSESSGKEVQ